MHTQDVIGILKARQGTMSLRELANQAKVSASYLSDLFAGKREPGPKIMKYLGLRKIRTSSYVPNNKRRIP